MADVRALRMIGFCLAIAALLTTSMAGLAVTAHNNATPAPAVIDAID